MALTVFSDTQLLPLSKCYLYGVVTFIYIYCSLKIPFKSLQFHKGTFNDKCKELNVR